MSQFRAERGRKAVEGKSRTRPDTRSARLGLAAPALERGVALPPHAPPSMILTLQRLAGNAAVARLLSEDPLVAGHDDASEAAAERAERAESPAHDEAGGPVDTSGLRLHTDTAAGELADALGAEAVSHGADVWFAPGAYRPHTKKGRRLLRHEVTHGRHHHDGKVHLKRVKKHLDFLVMKRNPTHITRMLAAKALTGVGLKDLGERVEPEDSYGHWWTEIGDLASTGAWYPRESYGWWPSTGVNIAQTLKLGKANTVDGQLNKGEQNDPHHGDNAPGFHPVLEVDDTEPYESIRARVTNSVQSFANGFKGTWNWRLAWGKNCHTFQERLKKHLGVHHQESKYWLKDPNADVNIAEKARDARDMALLSHFKGYEGIGGFIMFRPENVAPKIGLDDLDAMDDRLKWMVMQLLGCDAAQMNGWANYRFGQNNLFKDPPEGGDASEGTGTSSASQAEQVAPASDVEEEESD
jgi:Domain of unknown function (DUF4157)